jgi:hypothetical protein
MYGLISMVFLRLSHEMFHLRHHPRPPGTSKGRADIPAFVRCWRKNGSTMGLYISYLQI